MASSTSEWSGSLNAVLTSSMVRIAMMFPRNQRDLQAHAAFVSDDYRVRRHLGRSLGADSRVQIAVRIHALQPRELPPWPPGSHGRRQSCHAHVLLSRGLHLGLRHLWSLPRLDDHRSPHLPGADLPHDQTAGVTFLELLHGHGVVERVAGRPVVDFLPLGKGLQKREFEIHVGFSCVDGCGSRYNYN